MLYVHNGRKFVHILFYRRSFFIHRPGWPSDKFTVFSRWCWRISTTGKFILLSSVNALIFMLTKNISEQKRETILRNSRLKKRWRINSDTEFLFDKKHFSVEWHVKTKRLRLISISLLKSVIMKSFDSCLRTFEIFLNIISRIWLYRKRVMTLWHIISIFSPFRCQYLKFVPSAIG